MWSLLYYNTFRGKKKEKNQQCLRLYWGVHKKTSMSSVILPNQALYQTEPHPEVWNSPYYTLLWRGGQCKILFFFRKVIDIYRNDNYTINTRVSLACCARQASVLELADRHVWGACVHDVRVQVPSLAPYADMAESADALDSGSSGSNTVEVQVLLSAPRRNEFYSFRFFIS